MTNPAHIREKALIYATGPRGLLVFSEPDFADVPLQVPGGTIDLRETPATAARREFAEETGLATPSPLTAFHRQDHIFTRNNQPIHLRRHCFHLALTSTTASTWDHWEDHASNGAPPILFRFSWLSLSQAQSRLGLGMGAAIAP